jgi:hypothetical protein
VGNADTIHRIGYDAQYDSGSGYYEYRYVRMNGAVTLRSRQPFHRGDCVSVVSVDGERNVVTLAVHPEPADTVLSALMIVSNGIPFDHTAEHSWKESRCKVLLRNRANIQRNSTYIVALVAPVHGRSSLTATDSRTGDVFHFFMTERRR